MNDTTTIQCENCQGSGRSVYSTSPYCHMCAGSGRITVSTPTFFAPSLSPEAEVERCGDYEFPESARTINGRVLTSIEYAEVNAKACWGNGRAAPWKSTGILLRELSRLREQPEPVGDAELQKSIDCLDKKLWNVHDASEMEDMEQAAFDVVRAYRALHSQLSKRDAEVIRMREANTWRSISTAPRDATRVRISALDNEYIAIWSQIEKGLDGYQSPSMWYCDSGRRLLDEDVDGWLPLLVTAALPQDITTQESP